MIDCHFMNSCITRQIVFVNTSIRTQEIAQTCPTTFVGIDMHFSDAVSIVIACPFIFSVTHGMAYSLQAVVAVILISVECSFRLSEALYKRTECPALRILHHTNTHLARFSANHCTNWRSIILVGATPTSFVGSTTRWVLWISVPFSFFPQRSRTFRQSRLPDRSRVLSSVHALRWLATGGELPSLSCG
jgi:hypothetical protein